MARAGRGRRARTRRAPTAAPCERFAGWLVARAGAGAGAEELTLGRIGEYEDALRALGLSEATIRKDRSAVNGLVRFLADHDLIDRGQARLALARKLPSAQRGERERPKCLDDTAYRRLVTAAEARVATDALQGWRDVAIVRVLGDAGPRCEELLDLQRRDFLPKRQGAKLRAIRIRHGKGNRRRTVELTPAATRAVREWDARRRELGPPPGEPDLPLSEWPLFCTWAAAGATAATPASATGPPAPSCVIYSRSSASAPASTRTCATPTCCATPSRRATTAAPAASPSCSAYSATKTPRRR